MPGQSLQPYAYLDYAATAPLCPEAAEVLAGYLQQEGSGIPLDANPNSLHTPGRTAFQTLEAARKRIAAALDAPRPNEIIFTSSATESDCAALLGMATAAADSRFPGWNKDAVSSSSSDLEKPQVIVSAIEHDAVLKPAKRLASLGFRVAVLQPDKHGFITVETLEKALDSRTVLVSIQMANSEIGTVQPIAELAAASHASKALFHTDAVQALGKIPLSLKNLRADAASFSCHKVGGPKGVGILFLKSGTPFNPMMLGGGQEFGKRSGTQNVPGIQAAVAAVEAAVSCQSEESQRLCGLRDALFKDLNSMKGVFPTCLPPKGETAHYLPNIVHATIPALESETLIMKLDSLGFGVSGGSACASTSLAPSHVLTAIGIPADKAYGALRISMGRGTTLEQVRLFKEALLGIIEKA